MKFQLSSDFKPTGDQPKAIEALKNGINNNEKFQTLLGVTGSGKTFTVANVINEINRPTLVLAHNKTLAAQLYSEFKQFFPKNSVEYFVSYYDYYQPEAYIPASGTYIEKDLSINDEIEKLRLSTTSSLLSGRKDIIVVASVSCLYGIGNPIEFKKNIIHISKNLVIARTKLLNNLVQSLYSRTTNEFSHGNFRVKGDIIDIYPSYADNAFKIHFFGNEIEVIELFDPITNKILDSVDNLSIYPANMFATSQDVLLNTKGIALFSSGSPFKTITNGGKKFHTSQANNAYVFPGIGLGVLLSKVDIITDDIFLNAAHTLSKITSDNDLKNGKIYPSINQIRRTSIKIAYSIASTYNKKITYKDIDNEIYYPNYK